MTEGRATYAIELEADQLTSGADQGADALERLNESIESDLESIASLNKSLRLLKGSTTPNTAAIKALQDQIRAKKQTAAGATEKLIAMGGSIQKVKKSTTPTISSLQQFGDVLRANSAPMGALAAQSSQLISMLGAAGVAGAVALAAAALVAIAGAAVVAVGALAKYALTVQDARRSELLHLEAMTRLPNYFGIVAGKAGDMQRSIDRIAGSTPQSRSEISKFADTLYRAGLRGANFDAALEATSIRAAVFGSDMGAAFAQTAAMAAMSGRSVRGMLDDTKRRFGDLAARKMLSLDVQLSKMRENVSMLFSGVKIEGFLSGLNEVTRLFSQSSASGRALKTMLEALLNPLFGSAKSGAPIIKRLFQGAIIGALEFTITVLTLRNAISKFWKDNVSKRLPSIDTMNLALNAGVGLAKMLGVAFAAIGVVVGALVTYITAAIALWTAPLALFVLSVRTAINDITAIGNFVRDTWSKYGEDIVNGIVNGIKSGATRAIDAIGEVGSSMRDKFKAIWGIASPSKTSRGFALNIMRTQGDTYRAEAPRLAASYAAAAGPDSVTRGAGSAGGAARRGGAISLTIGEIHVHGSSTREQAEDLKTQVVVLLEQALLSIGGRLA